MHGARAARHAPPGASLPCTCASPHQLQPPRQHDIEARISRWDSLVAALKGVDERAHVRPPPPPHTGAHPLIAPRRALQKLTERIHLSLHSLRTDTAAQLAGAKDSVAKADERVALSQRALRRAGDAIQESTQAVRYRLGICFIWRRHAEMWGRPQDGQIEVLEERLVQEEATLDQIVIVTQLMLCPASLFWILEECARADENRCRRVLPRARPLPLDPHRVVGPPDRHRWRLKGVWEKSVPPVSV